MKIALPIVLLIALPAILASSPSFAQASAGWHDDLLDHLAGTWKVEGKILGHDAHHEVNAEWVLNHQFVRIFEKTAADAPASENRYEAVWFLGYDAVSERYVLHLLDILAVVFPKHSATAPVTAMKYVSSSSTPTAPSTPASAGLRKSQPGSGSWSKKTKTANGLRSPISN